ncbi:MAG: hypothetical protein IT178_08695 [Acidobacteria bacterium]|nr:hypothetical protein [Acidobacteriota bacterium]
MAGEITAYANELRGLLNAAGAGVPQLDALTAAATSLETLASSAPGTVTQPAWQSAKEQWDAALASVADRLGGALLGPLADLPGLAELVADPRTLITEGIRGSVDLGPVRLDVGSSVLVIMPPLFAGGAAPAEPVAIGPYGVGQVGATLASPFGGGTPGGGSLVRLTDGYGGTLELPLGPVQVSAAAIIAVIDGDPSFLAIMGVAFLPPIQLSFGFSLDRVGGIVGVNRRMNTEALRDAQRTGVAGDVLFAVRPPASPLALVSAANRLFPFQRATHLVGPSLKLAWLSFGPPGSLIGLDLAVIVEIPTGKVAILGVARAAIPGLPFLLNLRLDVLGIIDPVEQLVSIDASLVDSHVLGIFEVYGDAAMRLSWGSIGYMVVTVGGFFPGYNPEPARLPALRRVGLAMNMPIPIISMRAEGYFAVTSNSIHLGGRYEIGISLGIEAHGFVQVDAMVQFRPFYFEARIAAGFAISVAGFSFASVTLAGQISGPGPLVIRGSLSISLFIFSLSWDETFTIGSGPSDSLPSGPLLIDVMLEELNKAANVHSGSIADPQVVLSPQMRAGGFAAVPPTGTLQVQQRRAPLGLIIERVDGRPLSSPQGVRIAIGTSDVTERFSPGSYITLTGSEALNRPPFDVLPAGRVIAPADTGPSEGRIGDPRKVTQIVIRDGVLSVDGEGQRVSLATTAVLVGAARQAPALSDTSPLVTATQEEWRATSATTTFTSATAAHQFVRYNAGVAQAAADAAAPLNLAGV